MPQDKIIHQPNAFIPFYNQIAMETKEIPIFTVTRTKFMARSLKFSEALYSNNILKIFTTICFPVKD